jgi:methylthioribose-1-phosphate isomerase
VAAGIDRRLLDNFLRGSLMARRDEDDSAPDPTRREFFRTFSRQTLTNAGAVMGAAAEIRRAGGAAARELLDPSGSMATGTGVERRDVPPETASTFRSAYRLVDDALLLLDQRDLPGHLTIVKCSEPSEIASAMRAGVISAGPVLAEVAAYGLYIAIARAETVDPQGRDQIFRAAANTLRGARPDINALRAAVGRMETRYDELTVEGATDMGPADVPLAGAVRAEADSIASEAQLAHATLGRNGAAAIAAAVDSDTGRNATQPLGVLMHGDMGPLSCGMVGTGTALLQSLIGLGSSVHVWLTEAAPSMEGARIAALQLTQVDIPHTLVADTAVAWLLESRRLDGALVRGDTIAPGGDTLALIGSLSVARLAGAAGVPLYVVAPSSAFDASGSNLADLMPSLRSPAETLAASVANGESRPQLFGARLNPTSDIVPNELITSYLTDTGAHAGGARQTGRA